MIRQRRIYCLTPDPCSTLMWSHYTDKHRGICLEFGAGNVLFSEALEVIYRSEYPSWVPQEMEQSAFEMFLTKSDDWKYEKEFRIIGALNSDREHLILNGECLRLPPGALQSILVGCEADYAKVKEVVHEHASHLPVRHVVRAANQYRLVIE
jgi:hypothetical protein